MMDELTGSFEAQPDPTVRRSRLRLNLRGSQLRSSTTRRASGLHSLNCVMDLSSCTSKSSDRIFDGTDP